MLKCLRRRIRCVYLATSFCWGGRFLENTIWDGCSCNSSPAGYALANPLLWVVFSAPIGHGMTHVTQAWPITVFISLTQQLVQVWVWTPKPFNQNPVWCLGHWSLDKCISLLSVCRIFCMWAVSSLCVSSLVEKACWPVKLTPWIEYSRQKCAWQWRLSQRHL